MAQSPNPRSSVIVCGNIKSSQRPKLYAPINLFAYVAFLEKMRIRVSHPSEAENLSEVGIIHRSNTKINTTIILGFRKMLYF